MKKNIISIVIALVILAVIITGIIMIYNDYMQKKEEEAIVESAKMMVLDRINDLDYCADIREVLAHDGSIRINDISRWGIDFDVLDYEGNMYISNARVTYNCDSIYYEGVFNYWNS